MHLVPLEAHYAIQSTDFIAWGLGTDRCRRQQRDAMLAAASALPLRAPRWGFLAVHIFTIGLGAAPHKVQHRYWTWCSGPEAA